MDHILWHSPPIPNDLLDQEDFPLKVLEKAQELMSTDTPSSSDLDSIFVRYKASTARERDAIDAAFVWFTGYTLASIAAMVEADDPSEYETVLQEWRKRSLTRRH